MILNIDTATEVASIAISRSGEVLGMMVNADQKDHAAWIHLAIQQLLNDAGCSPRQLQAVAVTAGPGSYTGLRVGMATAKGLCYVLKIPLITESTLKVMAQAALEKMDEEPAHGLLCPMIDARRMEVFTAAYDRALQEVMEPQPMVLDNSSFSELMSQQGMLFFGSGSEKFRSLAPAGNASFRDVRHNAGHLSRVAEAKFRAGNFTDPAYSEPAYLKEFYTHTKK